MSRDGSVAQVFLVEADYGLTPLPDLTAEAQGSRCKHRGEPLVKRCLSNAGVLQKCRRVCKMMTILDTTKNT